MNPDLSRRRFVESLASGLLGVTVSPLAFGANAVTSRGTAKNIIYLFMEGGMSHLDTFDLRPDYPDIQGPVNGIKTNVPGIHVCEHLPKLAGHMDKLAQVRSLSHTQGNHEPGQYHVRTGYELDSGVIKHPALGSWVTKLSDRLNPAMPPYVRVGGLGGHPANGFFSVDNGPLPISDPSAGLQNSRLRDGLDRETFGKHLDLAAKLDSRFRTRHAGSKQTGAYTELYAEAVRLMASKDLDGFDIAQEFKETRDAYGDSPFGAGCLLARRLAERGVRFVEVDLPGWDTHSDNHKGQAEQCDKLDQPLSALLGDLASRGMLDETLVVVATEFGRSPEIDEYAGRGHHPFGYTCLLAGGGIAGGAVYGATSADAKTPSDNPVGVRDFNATIAHALGVDAGVYEKPFEGGQKFSILGKDTGSKGEAILELLG